MVSLCQAWAMDLARYIDNIIGSRPLATTLTHHLWSAIVQKDKKNCDTGELGTNELPHFPLPPPKPHSAAKLSTSFSALSFRKPPSRCPLPHDGPQPSRRLLSSLLTRELQGLFPFMPPATTTADQPPKRVILSKPDSPTRMRVAFFSWGILLLRNRICLTHQGGIWLSYFEKHHADRCDHRPGSGGMAE